jgi:hypothetical protein
MIRRLVSPPALPAFIRPGTAHGPEHVAAEDPGNEAGQTLGGNPIVDASLATIVTVHVLPGSRGKNQSMSVTPPTPSGFLNILVRPGAEAVD